MLAALRLGPVPRAALTSCCLMALGDVCCQTIQQRQVVEPKQPLKLDLGRTARFAVIGLTLHGPFFCKGFHWLDKCCGKDPSLGNAVRKSLLGQVTLFPTYTTLFLMYASLLEGKSAQYAFDNTMEKFPRLLVNGSFYWPVVNMLNFRFVPQQQRVLAVNVCAIAWNAYLSFVQSAPVQHVAAVLPAT